MCNTLYIYVGDLIAKFDGTKIIMGAISIIIGLVLLPLMAGFVYSSTHYQNATDVWVENTNVTGIAGLSSLLDLVLYGFCFGIVGLGIGLIYVGFKRSSK